MSILREGVYEDLITRALQEALAEAEARGQPFDRSRQELDWVDDALASHVAGFVRRALADAPGSEEGLARRVEIVSRLLTALQDLAGDVIALPADLPLPTRQALTWVGPERPGLASPRPPARPEHGLVHPALLFNGPRDISLVHELRAEIASADRIDAVVAFLKLSGLNLIRDALARFLDRGGELRLITTTYLGATQRKAVDALCALGARVRVAYEEGGTRLHAKAWLFHRHSGLCTAYVGSSNLSRAAMTEGAEWNVRVTRRRTPAVLERFEAAFDQLWEGLGRDHDREGDEDRLGAALRRAGAPKDDKLSALILALDVAPKPHQEEVLEALAVERAQGHTSNLVVSATGTGKTWISAFDYARLRRAGEVDTLLFVAHRKEILTQSRDVFRVVLRDPGFGELWVDGERPARGTHVFASVQSLRENLVRGLDPGSVHMLIVDEFHHAAANSYQALLTHLQPRFRLGLTATPERMDGKDVLTWFDHRTASEIHLWDALEAGLLAPFHYYGVHDPTSVERAWRRGRLDAGVLDNLYTGDHARAQRIVQAVGRYVADPSSMRALGFCVGVGHAELMARSFTDAGLPSVALHAGTDRRARIEAVQQLRTGALRAIFTVDLFNEGVDIPEVDTVLFLRPTESATVFLQQLGRGLRRHPDKAQLLVLDFVGHVHADYRYDVRYRAIVGGTTREVLRQIQRDFPRLPSGCAIQLEPAAREAVLTAVRRFVGQGGYNLLAEELRQLPSSTSLHDFLRRADRGLEEVFVPNRRRSWSDLRRRAGHEVRAEQEGEAVLRGRVGRMLHVDDPARLEVWSAWLRADRPPILRDLPPEEAALARMLLTSLGQPRVPVEGFQGELQRLWGFAAIRAELVELLATLRESVRHETAPLTLRSRAPFALHAAYARREVIAGLNVTAKGRLREHREGPLWVADRALDVFFVTLDKSTDAFKPSIRYADYPISATRFHWESQNNTHEGTAVGQRYVSHAERGSEVLFFVRERQADERGESLPFVCLGPATYVGHQGGRPMQIEWALAHPMPPRMLKVGRMVAP